MGTQSDIKLMIKECIDSSNEKIEIRLSGIERRLDHISSNELGHLISGIATLTSTVAVMGNDIGWIKKEYEDLKKNSTKNGDPTSLARDAEAKTNIVWLKDIFWKIIVPLLTLIIGAAVGRFLLIK